MMIDSPDCILFVQHGWTNTYQDILELAKVLKTVKDQIVALNFGCLRTWIKSQDILKLIKQKVAEVLNSYPDTLWRIIGYSLGGLLWLDFVDQHPELWSKINSIVLIGCPINGVDSFGIFKSSETKTAQYLLRSRKIITEKIAQSIPILSIAGDIGNKSDGAIGVETTQIVLGMFTCLPNLSHQELKTSPQVVKIIQKFWNLLPIRITPKKDLSIVLIERLQAIPGITDTQNLDFKRSQVYLLFQDGTSIHIWKNSLSIIYVFLVNKHRQCLYSGCVGLVNAQELQNNLEAIHQDYYELVIHGLG
ncbi:alpha/beta hydrolase [Cyanobacterium sp. uoEpiScrs1]|uniref:alpha/beta hydrolase n=1 Tax=Cyanobacterium sp. uoEpiScrs1 TaxID=2976343 RepID=UPI00226AB62C|nr:alpha/beta hydrolase [Cyanobacterium sp. uoEpiScrs1]